MSSSVTFVSVASSTTAAACSTPRTGSPVAVAHATRRSAVCGSAMSPHSTAISAPAARRRSMASARLLVGLRTGVEHDPPATRSPPREAISPARNRPRPPIPPVMMYAPSARKGRTFSGGTTATLLPARGHVEHHLAGVPGAGDQTDRGGSVVDRVARGARQWQFTRGGALVHGGQQAPDGLRVAEGQQRQVDGEQREVAAEREQPEVAVAVDVALAQLDEAPTQGQQFDARACYREAYRRKTPGDALQPNGHRGLGIGPGSLSGLYQYCPSEWRTESVPAG